MHSGIANRAQNSHAFHQLAYAYTIMGKLGEAIENLADAFHISEGYREKPIQGSTLQALKDHPDFNRLLNMVGGY